MTHMKAKLPNVTPGVARTSRMPSSGVSFVLKRIIRIIDAPPAMIPQNPTWSFHHCPVLRMIEFSNTQCTYLNIIEFFLIDIIDIEERQWISRSQKIDIGEKRRDAGEKGGRS